MEGAPERSGPRITITYCTQCKWLLRAAWMAQELLSTFETTLGYVTLRPGVGGVFRIEVDDVLVWERVRDNGFPAPIVTVTGLYIGILIGNSVLTEIVFNRPGLGKLIVGALAQRDYTMLQGMMVIYTGIVVLVNLATDLTYGLIDPRVQYR